MSVFIWVWKWDNAMLTSNTLSNLLHFTQIVRAGWVVMLCIAILWNAKNGNCKIALADLRTYYTSGTAGGSAAFLSRSLVGPILAKSKALRPCCECVYVEQHTKDNQWVVEYGDDKGGERHDWGLGMRCVCVGNKFTLRKISCVASREAFPPS